MSCDKLRMFIHCSSKETLGIGELASENNDIYLKLPQKLTSETSTFACLHDKNDNILI